MTTSVFAGEKTLINRARVGIGIIALLGVLVLGLIMIDHPGRESGGEQNGTLVVQGESVNVLALNRSWYAVSGTWSVSNDGIGVVTSEVDQSAILVTDARKTQYSFIFTVKQWAAGSGFIFRDINPENYWMITANPEFGTWDVRRVVDKNPTYVGYLRAVGCCITGTHFEVASRDDGALVVSVDGLINLSIIDKTMAGATMVGLIAAGSDAIKAKTKDIKILDRFPS